MKKAFIAPKMDVVKFAAEEITLSGTGLDDVIESPYPGDNNDTP